MYKSKIYILFKFSLLILFLQSMFAWFLWGQLIFAILLSVFTTFALMYTNKGVFNLSKVYIIPVFLLLIVQIYAVKDQNANALVAAILRIIILSIVLLLNDEIKINLFQFFTKSFAVLLAISMVAWLLFLIGVPLPHYQLLFADDMYTFDNYYFFLSNYNGAELPIPRFSSIFLEPGQVGMITSFLLCANRFELKRKPILIIFVATLMTFSLAAYILLLISATIYITLYSKKPLRNFIFWILLISSLFSFFANYNEGDNTVNNLITSRLVFEDGDMAGNNRFTEDLDEYFDKFMNTNDKYLGLGASTYNTLSWDGGNAGYKVFFLQYGIVGAFLVFLLYFSIVLLNRSKLAWILLLVYILCFIQAAYPLWESELIIFITAMPGFKLFSSKTKKQELNES